MKIKCLRSDRGGEYTSNEFLEFCEQHGIKRQFSVADTPKQNGVAERMNRTVQKMARAMLDDSGTPDILGRRSTYNIKHSQQGTCSCK